MLKSPPRVVRPQVAETASSRPARPEMLHRPPSDSGTPSSPAPSKKWRLPPLLRNKNSILKERSSRPAESDQTDAVGPRNDSTSALLDNESNHRQLRDILQRLRAGPSGHKEVDGAYDLYCKYKERANALCYAILHDELKTPRNASVATDSILRRDSSIESPNALYDQRSSFSGRSLAEVITSSGRSAQVSELGLNLVRDWRLHLESLAEWFKTNLAETYRKFEHDATPEMVESLFNSKRFRREAVHRMRNASVTRVMSADPQFFPRYEIRFRNYERVKQELVEIRSLVQAGESGISPDRKIDEITISTHGDAILEFANLSHETVNTESVLRFRVTSSMLAETSPIFARMFTGPSHRVQQHDIDDIHHQLPPPSTRFVCRDGSEAKLYRMPQLETNDHRAMEILLDAAHMHSERLPGEVSFDQFVAIAECCMRYKCTSPLEPIVEQRWLPQWMHKGAGDMPDGMLAISYAFGLRTLFTRMSESAILNLIDEQDLQTKPWPQRIRDKIWAIRCAKAAQVHACCTSTIQEYIREPAHNPADDIQPITPSDLRNNHHSTAPVQKASNCSLSTKPRCVKGSHWCDAGNLGWMMLVFNELNLMPQIVRPNVMSHLPNSAQQPSRSLAQIVEALRRVPSPLSPIHKGGACDASATFRAAVNDIYNSVSGLTLHDVSGKSHGWALSKHSEAEPQELSALGLGRMAGNDRSHHSVATEFPEHIRLKVLSYIDDLDDLHRAALISRSWYDTYQTHELYLMRNILRAGRVRSSAGAPMQPILPKSISNAEEKVPKDISDGMRATRQPDRTDVMTLRSEDDDDSDVESIDGTPAPSITESLWMEARLRQAQSRSANPHRFPTRSPPYPPHAIPPPHPPPPAGPDSIPTRSPSMGSPILTTPRQTPPPGSHGSIVRPVNTKPSFVHTEFATDEPPLTDEEARQILWGDEVDNDDGATPPVAQVVTPPERGHSEKFLSGDMLFAEGVMTEGKQLYSEHKHELAQLKRNAANK